jgi:hypothetical protein
MAVTKARQRAQKALAERHRAYLRSGEWTSVAKQEWWDWHWGGWASLWNDVERKEAMELLRLIDDFQCTTEAKDRFRQAPVIRAGRKRLGLDAPSPLADEAAPAVKPVKRKDPRT